MQFYGSQVSWWLTIESHVEILICGTAARKIGDIMAEIKKAGTGVGSKVVATGWEAAEKIAATSGRKFFKLPNNKDSRIVIFNDDPTVEESTFRNTVRNRFVFKITACDTGEEMVWTVGVQMFRVLRGLWKDIKGKPVRITRNGAKKSMNTVYDVKVVTADEAKNAGASSKTVEKTK